MPIKHTIRNPKISPEKAQLARELRHHQTPSEAVLWERLRANRLEGYHFRRQQVIAGFIVDFYCHASALIVELDGSIHDHQIEIDAARDQCLTALGYQVIRFQNQAVLENVEGVLHQIWVACEQRRT